VRTDDPILCFGIEFFRFLIPIIFGGIGSQDLGYIKTYENTPIISAFSHDGLDALLFRYSRKTPPLTEQLYVFMKRFRTQPSEFYNLERSVRLELYRVEAKLIEKEIKDSEKSREKSERLSNK